MKITVTSKIEGQQTVLNQDAMSFLNALCKKFAANIPELLKLRVSRQEKIDKGHLLDFLDETKDIRDSVWHIKGIPADLLDRRVEITGPVERKMIINALNADVKVFMADFEDSLAPSFEKLIQGQINLKDAINEEIDFTAPDTKKEYKLNPDPAVLIARVRGLHLKEKHVLYDGEQIPGCLFDFAIYFINNYEKLIAKGSGPYFYIPKLESYLEARWWAEVFAYAEEYCNLEPGTIKCTCLIETLPAVFQMNEILYELRSNIVGLNCGRWDYIFSYIKTLKNHPDRVLPDRQVVTMEQPFLTAYSKLLVKTCHRRGAFAMGGMAAFIPMRDSVQNQGVLNKVYKDKEWEAKNGHDGTWIAHPGLAQVANEVFASYLKDRPNQLDVMRDMDEPITAHDLLAPCSGERTETGMRLNIRIALRYIEAWISGNGCVPIYGLMEDAATAEISRVSIWQWIKHKQELSNGKLVTKELFMQMLKEELEVVKEEISEEVFVKGRFDDAAKLLEHITTSSELISFLTLAGYELLD